MVLAAGSSILREEGLGTGAEVLTFKRVFERVEQDTGVRLSHASVTRRVWENQAEFQADVLVSMAGDIDEGDVTRTQAAVAAVLVDLHLDSEESRVATARELTRVACSSPVTLRQTPHWASLLTIWAFGSQVRADAQIDSIRAAIADKYEASTERNQRAYADLNALLGLRLRENFTMRQFTTSAEALGRGFELLKGVDGTSIESVRRATGPHGEMREWSLFAIGVESLFFQYFEIDPDWQPGDDVASDGSAQTPPSA